MMVRAEQWWVCETQRCLTNNDKFHVVKRQLNLFQDPQGRWCFEGRIHNANLPYSTQLVVLHDHERVFHNRVKETLTEIRSQYWITNGRAVVQKLIHSCITCWRLEAMAYKGSMSTTASNLQSQWGSSLHLWGNKLRWTIVCQTSWVKNRR